MYVFAIANKRNQIHKKVGNIQSTENYMKFGKSS